MPNLDRLGPALAALRKAAKLRQLDVARRIHDAVHDDETAVTAEPKPQTLKNYVSEIERGVGLTPRARVIDAYLDAVGASWLDLGRRMERLAEAAGTPSESLRRERLAEEGEAILDEVIRQAADEAAGRAAESVIRKLRDGLGSAVRDEHEGSGQGA